MYLCELLCLHVMQKAWLCNCPSFFLFPTSFLSQFLEGPTESFLVYISSSVTQDCVTSIQLLLLDTLVNVFVKATLIVKSLIKIFKGYFKHSLSRSQVKLKPLYLHHQNLYCHQTWQVGDLLWGAPIYVVFFY